MSYTKRQFITAALEELGLGTSVFEVQPEELESALRRLDAMISEWNARGIRLGYPLSSTPGGSNLSDSSNVPDSANEAIITNLAIKLAPSFGKQVMRETKITAKRGLDTLVMLSGVTQPIEKQIPSSMPLGAGNKRRGPFADTPTDPVDASSAGELDFN